MISGSEHPLVPGYELLELRGRNGHLVYLARQSSSGLLVHLNVVNGSGDFGRMVSENLRQQAAALATLDHPNILRVVEIGSAQGNGFFSALEYAEGGRLADRIRYGPLAWNEAAAVARAIASAMQYARARDVQADLNARSVVLMADNAPKLTDFRPTGAERETALLRKSFTLGYVAPEEMSDFEDVGSTPGTDVYRVGAVLYVMLTGQAAFSRVGDGTTTIRQICEDSPTPVRQRNPTVPADLEAICMRCLETQPAHRYAESGDLVDVLGEFLAATQRTG